LDAPLGWYEMPKLLAALNRRIVVSSTCSEPLLTKRMPLVGGLTPKMSRPRMKPTSVVAGMLKVMPLPPARAPPSVYGQEMVIDLMMLTAPKPPGSRQLISPPAAVLEMAPAKVLQGAVRLHGLTSSPTPETQVRVACAAAGVA
jgi:hypothetical protein